MVLVGEGGEGGVRLVLLSVSVSAIGMMAECQRPRSSYIVCRRCTMNHLEGADIARVGGIRIVHILENLGCGGVSAASLADTFVPRIFDVYLWRSGRPLHKEVGDSASSLS